MKRYYGKINRLRRGYFRRNLKIEILVGWKYRATENLTSTSCAFWTLRGRNIARFYYSSFFRTQWRFPK